MNVRIIAIFTHFLLLLLAADNTHAQSLEFKIIRAGEGFSFAAVQNGEVLVNKADDTFFTRYRKSLDLIPILDDMMSSASVDKLRKDSFFSEFWF